MKSQHQLEQHAGLIYKSAWAAARSCGLLDEIDDVLQEAWVSACEALRRYNPKKAALSTHLANAVYLQTLSYYGRRQRFDTLPHGYDVASTDNSGEWLLFWESLSDNEKEMAAYTMRPEAGRRTAIVKHFSRLWGYMTAEAVARGLGKKLAAC